MDFALQGSSSVNCLNSRRFRIMTSNPIVTITIRANPNQPRTIAEVPTPLLTLPFPRSWAIVLAPTDAVCCHSTDTSTNTAATNIKARATCDTGREGKGFTSTSDPLGSVSSCHPGKVARTMKQKKARMTAMMLGIISQMDAIFGADGCGLTSGMGKQRRPWTLMQPRRGSADLGLL